MATIQGIYLALFGRPADPAGLEYFGGVTGNGADLSAIGDLASTEEYRSRFVGMDNAEIVDAIFLGLFGRHADDEGLAFFTEALHSGAQTINTIAINILDGARGDDIAVLQNRLDGASLFTLLLDRAEEIAAYAGDAAANIGRQFIAAITATDEGTFEEAQAAIASLFPPTPDTTPPTVEVSIADASLMVGEQTVVTFTFSEEVEGFTPTDLGVTGGTLSGFRQSEDDPKVFTVVFTADASGFAHIDITGAYADKAGNAGRLPDEVPVIDVGPKTPGEETNPLAFTSGEAASVAENVLTTTAVYDADVSGNSGPVTFALGGADALKFGINVATGQVYFLAAPDFETPADTGANNVYDIVVSATDTAGNTAAKTVAITVTNIDDTAPVFISGTTASVAENTATATVVYTAAATDAGPITYSISGTDAALFGIDPTGGAVKFLASPDYETPLDAGADNVYDFVVTATSGGLATDRNVAVSVIDQASIRLVSVNSNGVKGNLDTVQSVISSDGRLTAFDSDAGNLVDGDTNGARDIFVHDLQSGSTERVSISSAGAQSAFASNYTKISADGRFVIFESGDGNLAANDTNGASDIFVHDRELGTTARVSVASGGTEANGGSEYAGISADGRFVTFSSLANNLVVGDTNGSGDIFVHDRNTATTERISVDSAGSEANGDSNIFSYISDDGNFLAFSSLASNLASGDNNNARDVFLRDRANGATTLVSVDSFGTASNGDSDVDDMSADGRYIVFTSVADNLAPGDTNAISDIFVRDMQTGVTEMVTVSSAGTVGNDTSGGADISDDGRYVVFGSAANNLVANDNNGTLDIFVRDRLNGTTARINIDFNGNETNDFSSDPSISSDGRYVTFASFASNLTADDTDAQSDAYVVDGLEQGWWFA